MKKQLLVLTIFLLAGFWAIGQGNENFTNYPETANAYHDGTFSGMDGSTWSYTQCRGDSVIIAPSPTFGKKRPATSKIISGILHNGCGTISFDYKQTFSSAVNLNLLINGLVVKNVTTTGPGVVHNSGPVTVNTPGDFIIMLKQADSSNSGQVTVDNIVWTSFIGGPAPEPTNYPTAFTATPSPFAISCAWMDATGAQLPVAYLLLASEQDDIVSPVDGTPVSNDPNLADGHGALNILQGVQTAAFGNLPSGKLYYFKIFPYTNSGALIDYKTDGTPPYATATTPNTTIIESIHFTDYSFSNWILKNVTGAQVWKIDSIHGISGGPCAKMSGYTTVSNVNEDWVISPAMNFNNYSNESMTFQSAYNYTGPVLQALISNNYDGAGDPNNFTWLPLTATLSPGGYVWTPSGIVSLNGTNGAQVYVGFKYTSSATEASTWELDDIVITGDLGSGVAEKAARDDGFTINPNPASGKCSLAFRHEGLREIRVISVIGAIIKETSTDQMNCSLDLNALSAGIYFVRVFMPETKTSLVKKLIVR